MAKIFSRKKIWVHTIVKNEENYIWFALMSVVDFVDKILVWDTGSIDKTVEIIKQVKKLKGDKIDFKEVGKVDKFQYTKMRQKMLDESDCDWILILDGDEVWWQSSIERVVEMIQIKGDELEAIVVPFYNLVGDIYHYQEDLAGEYQLAGRKGHLTVRAINRKIPGLHVLGSYGEEGYFDLQNRLIFQRDSQKLIYLDASFLHFSHLKRSSKQREKKYKHDLGKSFPKDFKYPDVLIADFPKAVTSPWQKRDPLFVLVSTVKYLLTFVRRRIKNKL